MPEDIKMPMLPQEPENRLFAGRAARTLYETKLSIYSRLSAFYKNLRTLNEAINDARHGINIVNPSDCSKFERDEFGNYKIICPYCLNKFEVGDFLFRAEMREDAEGNALGFVPEEDDLYIKHWNSMDTKGLESLRKKILDMDPGHGEIQSVTFETDKTGGTDNVPYSADARQRMKKQKVLGVVDKYGNYTTIRICPHCHTELPADLGFSPNFIYAFMGNSNCGKSIYLQRLILSLTSAKFLNGDLFGLCVNDEMAAFGETAHDAAASLFSLEETPLMIPTNVGYIPPKIIRLQDIYGNRYFITLFDYPGEAIWMDDNFFTPLATRVRDNSNGLIVVFDCGVTLALKGFLAPEYSPLNKELNDKAKASALQVINRIYAKTFHGQCVARKPTALVLAKSDLMFTCMNQLAGSALPESPRVLQPSESHSKPMLGDFYQCHTEIKRFLETLEPGTTKAAEVMCSGNHAWFGVSSTTVPLVNGMIPSGAKVSGLRETDPLEWLLYRNGYLSGKLPDDSPEVKAWAESFQAGLNERVQRLERLWFGNDDPHAGLEETYRELYGLREDQAVPENLNLGMKRLYDDLYNSYVSLQTAGSRA